MDSESKNMKESDPSAMQMSYGVHNSISVERLPVKLCNRRNSAARLRSSDLAIKKESIAKNDAAVNYDYSDHFNDSSI